MRRTTGISIVLASCLTALLWAGDAAASAGNAGAEDGAARKSRCNGDAESVFVFTNIGENRYLSYQAVVLDPPVSEIWPVLRDAERFVLAVLPDVAPTFLWVDGGGPEIIPSSFQFTSGGVTLHEEAVYRSDELHQVLYRLREPAFGMQEYYAFGEVTRVCGQKTLLEYTRVLDLAPGTDTEFFRTLFTQEFLDIQTYFNE
ncbi:uncharacterized protein SOCE26_010250 [Sorangium cellulosum]|uniref:Secreted protein n=1 Tax=Sorangium cellulosum TaxID=56 RepID=A0A2L0EK10_SORCE|nr:hypothetical protein [Sorangium cellulosum]AUX39630.1 uncharacterized protein SOCE26_010250 [Sorangium cellulosum]